MYKEMYLHLFNIITDSLNEPDYQKAREILKRGQIETEEMYIDSKDFELFEIIQ